MFKEPVQNSASLLAKIDSWRADDWEDSEDRAALMDWYSGGALSQDSDNMEMVGNTNFLLGHRYVSRAHDELLSPYIRGKSFIELEIDEARDPKRKKYLQDTVPRLLSRVIRDSGRMKYPYKQACGDAVLYGTPFLCRFDPNDWVPKSMGMPLMPRDAPADILDDRFRDWAFRSELTGREIMRMLKLVGSRKPTRWSKKALEALLDSIVTAQSEFNQGTALYSTSFSTPEEWEEQLQTNAIGVGTLNTSVPVYWYFCRKMETGKVDLHCLSRYGESIVAESGQVTRTDTRGAGDDDRTLFYREEVFDKVTDCLYSFLLDTALGGTPKMYRVVGLGRLNYDIDRKIAELINVGLAGVEDDFTPMYQAQDGSSLPQLEMLMRNGIRRNGVLPPELTTFEKGTRTKNYQHLFQFTSMFAQIEAENAAGHGGADTGKGKNELEVQALERQSEKNRNIANRMLAWLESSDKMIDSIYRTFTRTDLIPTDRAFDEATEFQDLLKKRGIDLREIQPDNVRARMQRLPGFGSQQLAQQQAGALMQVIDRYAPASQKIILHDYTAAVTDSHERADLLVPEKTGPQEDQVEQAQHESAYALIVGIAPAMGTTDMDLEHLPVHARDTGAAIQLISADQKALPSQTVGLAALLEHMGIHVQRLDKMGAPAAKQWGQVVQKLAIEAQALQQLVEDPEEQAKEQQKLQIQAQDAQLRIETQKAKMEQFERAQANREESDAASQAVSMNREAREDRKAQFNEAAESAKIQIKSSERDIKAVAVLKGDGDGDT
jgi:hypothetical protein